MVYLILGWYCGQNAKSSVCKEVKLTRSNTTAKLIHDVLCISSLREVDYLFYSLSMFL